MNYHSKSQYHDAFASMVKITLRDGDATESEVIFLEHLMQKLSLNEEEYEFIMQNYMKYPISVPYSYDERINALYQLGKIVNSDLRLVGNEKNTWLARVGKAIGFEPNCIEEITSKALALTAQQTDYEKFNLDIRAILIKNQAEY